MEFHPFAEAYDLMEPEERAWLTEDMKRHGFDKRCAIVLYQGKILDGRNRQLCAEEAGVTPEFDDFNGDDEAAKQFVIRHNENRRHLKEEWLRRRRKARVARVSEARKGGKSLRAIAETEGVSVGQVQRDIEESSGVSPPDTPEPEEKKIIGRDGKEYPAPKPKAEPEAEEDSPASDMRQKAEKALGQLVRSLENMGLYPKHKASLDAISKDLHSRRWSA